MRCKRAYEAPASSDGRRILVDRLWPRNCRKESLMIDAWLRDVAPSAELRSAFKRGELDFKAFRERYRKELAAQPGHWWPLLEAASHGTVTLIYAAKDEAHNNAQILAEWLEDELERYDGPSSPACYAHERLD